MRKTSLAVWAIFFLVPSLAQAGNDAQKIANVYGVSHWKDVEAFRFTFEPKIAGAHMKRAWLWEVKANRVTCHWKSWGLIPRSHTYSPGMLDQGDKKLNEEVDRWFINDKFWCLFPLQLAWDTSATVTEKGNKPLPIKTGTSSDLMAKMLTIAYPRTGGGYTPGDMYDVYYTGEGMIEQWSYHKAGVEKPTLTVTWEDQKKVGPLIMAMQHQNQNGLFRLSISDVALKLLHDPVWHAPADLKQSF
jgi:hypothetical protein